MKKIYNSWENKVFFGLYEKIQVVLKIFLKKLKIEIRVG
jgi:hypothetical protein